MKIKCMIVDDEPLALDVLEVYINKYDDLELCCKASNALEASELLKSHHPDVMFLDIHMPEIDGITFFKQLKNPPLVVFTTAFSEYAITGFELNAIDYLLKPIAPDRFEKAVNKVKEYYQIKQQGQDLSSEIEDESIFIKANSKQVKVHFSDILYVEAFADYVKIYTAERRIVTLQTMKNMEKILPADRFCRIHRSFIVAIDKINAYSSTEAEVGSQKLPVGKNYKEHFQKAMSGLHLH